MTFIIFTLIILLAAVPVFMGIKQPADTHSVEKEKPRLAKKFVRLPNGINLEYVEQGSPEGIPVLLLHGWTDSWNSFDRVFSLLPSSYHVFAPSLRGHGDSDKPFQGYNPQDFSEDVAAFMNAVDLDSAIFVGFSMGGVVAKRFALDYPDRVDGLVLIGTPVNLNEKPEIDELWELLLTLEDPIDPDFIRAFNEGVPVKPVPPEFLENINRANMKVPAHVWRDAFMGVWEADMMGEISAVKSPTLVVWGEHDSFTTIEDQKEITSVIPHSELRIYSGNGHAVHWEEPERFSADLIQFIENQIR